MERGRHAMIRAMRFLHVLNGDAVAGKLAGADVPGTLAVWADVLHEGPVPPDDDLSAWLRTRATFLESSGLAADRDALARLTLWQAALEAYLDYDEVVLWFEHDLFDQLLLVRHLAWFAKQAEAVASPTLSGLPDGVALTLICIGSHPEVVAFHGLGQLTAEQLTQLFSEREAVTPEQMDAGLDAWCAFTAPDPTALQRLARVDHEALPFLSGALTRLLEEYPSTRNGLGRTEQQIVEILADGPVSAAVLFARNQDREERQFMGDSTFGLRLRVLAAGPSPLVKLSGDVAGGILRGDVTLTDDGRRVLEGRADWIVLCGIDQWIGGVHLERGAAWRWDAATGRLIAPPPS